MDVTDATFATEVVERSKTTPVVVDLWAEWCGPCKQLGPILEKVIGETDGAVVLAKVDVDTNRAVAEAFKVQSIPAVYAMVDGAVVDGFVGAQGEDAVREFVARISPSDEDNEVAALIEAGDEASLRRALEIAPADDAVIVALARWLIVESGTEDHRAEGLDLLAKVPDTPESRHLAAVARTGAEVSDDEIVAMLDDLLTRVSGDDEARAEFVDLLERLGPDDPRTATYRKRLTAALY